MAIEDRREREVARAQDTLFLLSGVFTATQNPRGMSSLVRPVQSWLAALTGEKDPSEIPAPDISTPEGAALAMSNDFFLSGLTRHAEQEARRRMLEQENYKVDPGEVSALMERARAMRRRT